MNRILFLVVLGSLCFPATSFEMTYGTSGNDIGEAVIETSDGGYIIAGNAGSDAVLIKIDNLGNQTWDQTYDILGSSDYTTDIKETNDGGYIMTGSANSPGTVDNIYGYVIWLLKTTSDGTVEWQRTFQTDTTDPDGDGDNTGKGAGVSIDITSDGGYILFANSDVNEGGTVDTYVIKTDASGNELSRDIHEGLNVQSGLALSDGGYIFTALTAYPWNAWVKRVDNAGTVSWSNEYGSSTLYSIEETSDGGYIAGGSAGGDLRLIKLDSNGNEDFDLLYDSSNYTHVAYSVDQANDGYIAAGYKYNFSGNQNIWVLKVNSVGAEEWDQTYPVSNSADDWAYSVKSASDDGYILTGYTKSSGAGQKDIYILKTDEDGNVIPCEAEYDCAGVCDGTAVFDACGVCDGGNADMDCDGVCDGDAVEDDDGSCLPVVDGCTDTYADNYNPDANWDDGSCTYPDNGDYSLSFDGEGDYVEIENSEQFNPGYSDFSITTWIKVDEAIDGIFISKRGVGPSGLHLGQFYQIYTKLNGNIYYSFAFDHYTGNPYLTDCECFLPIDDSEWHFIALVFDRDGYGTIYLDGEYCAQADISGQAGDISVDDKFQLGGWNSESYQGSMDETSFWMRTLSPEEINEIMYSTMIDNDEQLVAHWKFNEGYGNMIYDSSVNEHNGLINGNPQWIYDGPILGCTDDTACNYNPGAIEDGSCAYESDCNGECGGTAVEDECGECGGSGIPDGECDCGGNIDDCNDDCGGEAYLDDCGVCSAGMSGHSPNYDIDCNGDCAADTPISCEDTTENSQCGNAAEDDCDMCSGGNSGHIANSDMDECSACFGDNFAELCIDSEECTLMDCNGDCDGESSMDNCNVCSEGNTGHPFNSDMDCTYDADDESTWEAACFGPAIVDSFDTCCLDPAHIDGCGECVGNDYDLCDGDGDGDYNIDDWGYGAHGFGEDGIDVQDVPEDQGSRVYITFHKSFYDTDTLRNTESYTIERLDGVTWTSLHSIAAYGSETYQTVAETLNNATETDTIYIEFRIIASMEEGNYVSLDDENGMGYSIDNIHPETPQLTSAEHDGNDITLNWQYELEEDFAYHRITSLNSIDNTISNEHSFTLNGHDEHWVNSVDIHGNLSEKTLSTMSMALGQGANLRSFNVLPDDNSITNVMASIEGNATGVIGQGVAANYMEGAGWMGSLSAIDLHSGYWIMVSEDDVLLLMGEPTSRDSVYVLEEGANLISYPFRHETVLEEALPEGIGCDISGIIGEGVAATCMNGNWMGSLDALEGSYGYWFIAEVDMEIIFNGCDEQECASLSRQSQNLSTVPEGYEYKQSTTQAFYFLENIENVEVGDWILAYNGDEVIGAREWQGSIIDVPAMGYDGSDYTNGYMKAGSVPQFKLLQDGKLIDLDGDIPAFENNQLYMVSSLTEAMPLPESFSLDRAYPNPFNPTTTLSFALPIEAEVSLSIYNLQGREVSTLIEGNMDAGYHSIVWNANSYASGVYFVKMVAGEFVNTQKLMLIK